MEEFKFACLENRELESKHINYRSQTVVQNYSKFNSKTLVELTSCHIVLWWKSPWQPWRKTTFNTGRSKINIFFGFLVTSTLWSEKKTDLLFRKSQRIRKWLMENLIEAVKQNFFWELWDRKSLFVNINLTFEPIRNSTIQKQEINSQTFRPKASLKANWCWLERWWKN